MSHRRLSDLYDSLEPEPTGNEPFLPSKTKKKALRAMVTAGIHPKYIHAIRRTGRMISEDNVDNLPPEALDEQNAAIEEYFQWHAMAEEALRSGALPAVAYAIERTGKRQPEKLEVTDGSVTGDVEWLEAFNEYMDLHPEAMTDEYYDQLASGKDPVH